jgi:peptide/nickel transport system substrate-binding protein
MISAFKQLAALSVVVVAAGALGACGSGTSASTGAASGQPKYGGTLNIVAASGQDHFDPVSAYGTWDYMMERADTRQLVSYPAVYYTALGDAGWQQDIAPVADVATQVPTVADGGITDNGLTYTFHIKNGVDWNNGRQVTSQDFLREYKAFGNPAQPVGNNGYFNTTIAGMKQYFDSEQAYFANKTPTAASIAAYQNSHSISGISTPNSSTIVFHLVQPAADFLTMLAMPFNSARPVEYDSYVPDSAQMRQHIMSDGPYMISSYTPAKQVVLVRNPAWKHSTDLLRHQYVSKVVVTMGVTNATTQVDEIQAGTEDLQMDTPYPPDLISSMLASHNSDFHVWPWSDILPYLVFNLRSPDSGKATGMLAVRQAIAFGVNKAALVKLYGGPTIAQPISTAIPPGNVGYAPVSLYDTPGSQGSPSKCMAMLKSAGYPSGITLTDLYLNDSVGTSLFESVQAGLANCGIHLKGKPEPISSYFVDLGNAPQNNKPNQWDVAQATWIPDWFGDNGRTVIQPFFQTNCVLNTVNYGCFSNTQEDATIAAALQAPTEAAAAPLWHKADLIAQQNAVIVPLINQYQPEIQSSRVASPGTPGGVVLWTPNIGNPDITNIYIK